MNILKKIFHYAFLVIFYLVSVIAITTVISESFFAAAIGLPLGLFVLRLVLKRRSTRSLRKTGSSWPILQLISTGVMLLFAFTLQVAFSWDWGDLIKSAYKIAMGQGNPLTEYFARYPNNRFWLAVLTGLFKLIALFYKDVPIEICKGITIVCSVGLVQWTIYLIYKTAGKLWSADQAFLVGCAALLFLPFYLYAQFAYTDTPAMLLIAAIAYWYVDFRQTGRGKLRPWLLAAILGALSAFLYQIKIMGIIVLIAILIDTVLGMDTLKKVKTVLLSFVALALSFLCCISLMNGISNLVVPISDELADQYEFPMTHWVMMGLGKSGGYRQVDVDYTISFPTYEEKVEGTVTEIQNRLNDRGLHGTAVHILVTKMARTWGNDHFAGADYVHRYTLHPDTIMYDLFTLEGDLHCIRDIYTGMYHILMLLGILLAAFFALKCKEDDPLLYARIALFGMTLFMMLWECNSRYLMIFAPLLLLCSCDGWFSAVGHFRKRAADRR